MEQTTKDTRVKSDSPQGKPQAGPSKGAPEGSVVGETAAPRVSLPKTFQWDRTWSWG